MIDRFVDDHTPHEIADEPGGGLEAPPYVLVVDDEHVVRDFLTRCLSGGGYDVKTAASAADAIESMMERPAPVLLCDVRMPGHDGLWLANRVRAHWPETRVVMATAIDDVETVRQSREVGAFDFITKPIQPKQLLQVVGRAAAAAAPVEQEIALAEITAPLADLQTPLETKIEAEYTLECPVRCPACGERIATVKAVRLVRAQVNFTSTFPRRGRVIACPHCLAVISAELTNF